jgi:site-specific DNA recombinase
LRARLHSAAAQRDRVVSPAGVLKAIEDGAYHPTLKKRLTLLEGVKAAAAARLARSQSKLVLRLHPNLPVIYQRKVQQLTAALNEPDTAVEAVEIIRGLIDRIVLTSSDGILKAELYGDLAAT